MSFDSGVSLAPVASGFLGVDLKQSSLLNLRGLTKYEENFYHLRSVSDAMIDPEMMTSHGAVH